MEKWQQFIREHREKRWYQPVVFEPDVTEIRGLWDGATKQLADILLADVAGKSVLDVGCNMGLLSHYLHDKGCKVTGIDMDEKVITGAKMVANILGKDIDFKYLDLDHAKIEEEYDTVCLFSVIHHVANFKEVNIARQE